MAPYPLVEAMIFLREWVEVQTDKAATMVISASSIRAAVDSATFDLAGQDVSAILHGDDL